MTKVLAGTVLALSLFTMPVFAQNCCVTTNGGYAANCSYCNSIITIDSSPQPSTSRTVRDNLEILLKSAKSEYDSEDSKWFNSSKARDVAKAKVDAYKSLLKTLVD